jgi:hypothetical protein
VKGRPRFPIGEQYIATFYLEAFSSYSTMRFGWDFIFPCRGTPFHHTRSKGPHSPRGPKFRVRKLGSLVYLVEWSLLCLVLVKWHARLILQTIARYNVSRSSTAHSQLYLKCQCHSSLIHNSVKILVNIRVCSRLSMWDFDGLCYWCRFQAFSKLFVPLTNTRLSKIQFLHELHVCDWM